MQFVEVGGRALHMKVEGPEGGRAVLFVNSLGTDFRIWDRVIPLLPKGLRVIRYDKRGHGLSDGAKRGTWGMEDHVADAATVLDALGAKAAVAVGLSIGGAIVQGLAASRPDLVRALVLCDTRASFGPPEAWAQRIAAVEAGGIESIADGVMERWFTAAFRASGELRLWRNMLTRTPLEGYLGSCEALRDADLTESTARLRLPAIALCGEEDGATPPDLVRETAALIPGAEFHLVPGAGHIPCVERPEAVAGLIAEFIRRVGHV